MEAVKAERRTAAAAATDGARRRPLVPSEKNNAASAGRRTEGHSRFKPVAPGAPAPVPAASGARRCSSPSPGRASVAEGGGSATCNNNNRARSADRARPAASAPPSPSRLKPSAAAARSAVSPRDAAAADGHGTPPRARNARKTSSGDLWASAARSSSSSPLRLRPEPVQVQSHATASKVDRLVQGLPSEQATKLRPAAGAVAERKRSPRRGSSSSNTGDQCENARPSESPADISVAVAEKRRWPGMMTTGRGQGSAGLTTASTTPAAAPAENEKASCCRSVSSSDASAGRSLRQTQRPSEAGTSTAGKSLKKRPSNEMAKIVAHRRRKDKADSGSDDTCSQTSESSKSSCRPYNKPISSLAAVPHRSSSSPRQGLLAAASSASRTCQSPSRMRPSASAPAPCQSKCASCSAAHSGAEQPVFNYIVDARKGKKSAGQIENTHQLRLLSSRYLQWRFVNARSEETQSHKNSVESILYSAWKSILTLRDALTITRTNVRHLQQEVKLYAILTEQIGYLEQWPVLEEECSDTLAEATKALKASTLCLPVTSGAHADGTAVRNAISSAVDVMQALSSSIYCVQTKVEDRTYLVSELSVMARQEKLALEQCRELLATAAKLQVQEASLRTLLMQLRRQRSSG